MLERSCRNDLGRTLFARKATAVLCAVSSFYLEPDSGFFGPNPKEFIAVTQLLSRECSVSLYIKKMLCISSSAMKFMWCLTLFNDGTVWKFLLLKSWKCFHYKSILLKLFFYRCFYKFLITYKTLDLRCIHVPKYFFSIELRTLIRKQYLKYFLYLKMKL